MKITLKRLSRNKKNIIYEHDYDDTIGDDDGCSPALEAGKAGSLGWPVTDPQLPGSPHVDHQDDRDDHDYHDYHHLRTTWNNLDITLRQLGHIFVQQP